MPAVKSFILNANARAILLHGRVMEILTQLKSRAMVNPKHQKSAAKETRSKVLHGIVDSTQTGRESYFPSAPKDKFMNIWRDYSRFAPSTQNLQTHLLGQLKQISPSSPKKAVIRALVYLSYPFKRWNNSS